MNDHIVICEHKPATIIEEHEYQMTRQRARKHYDLTAVTGDRPLNLGRLAILEEAITDGTFYGNYFATAYCDELGDEEIRVNAKHTARAWINPAVPLVKPNGDPYKVKYITYRVATRVGLAILNNQFDDSRSSRNMNDSNRVFGNLLPVLEKAPASVVNAIIRGVAFGYHGTSYVSVNKTDRGLLLLEYPEFCGFAVALLTISNDVQFLRRPEVVAAIWSSFKECPKRAIKFWMSVAGDNKKFSTERTLENALRHYAGNAKAGRPTFPMMMETNAMCDRKWITWANKNGTSLRRPRSQEGSLIMQNLFYVIAFVETFDVCAYCGNGEEVDHIGDPNIRVFTDREEAAVVARRESFAGALHTRVVKVHRDFLDVVAVP